MIKFAFVAGSPYSLDSPIELTLETDTGAWRVECQPFPKPNITYAQHPSYKPSSSIWKWYSIVHNTKEVYSHPGKNSNVYYYNNNIKCNFCDVKYKFSVHNDRTRLLKKHMENCKINLKRMEAARNHPDPEIAAFFKSRPPSYSHDDLYLELIIDMILSSNTVINICTNKDFRRIPNACLTPI